MEKGSINKNSKKKGKKGKNSRLAQFWKLPKEITEPWTQALNLPDNSPSEVQAKSASIASAFQVVCNALDPGIGLPPNMLGRAVAKLYEIACKAGGPSTDAAVAAARAGEQVFAAAEAVDESVKAYIETSAAAGESVAVSSGQQTGGKEGDEPEVKEDVGRTVDGEPNQPCQVDKRVRAGGRAAVSVYRGMRWGENLLSSRVRLFAFAGWTEKATNVLSEEFVREGVTPKLRTFQPLLDVFACLGDMDAADRVWQLMSNHGLQPGDVELASYLDAIVRADLDKQGKAVQQGSQEKGEGGDGGVQGGFTNDGEGNIRVLSDAAKTKCFGLLEESAERNNVVGSSALVKSLQRLFKACGWRCEFTRIDKSGRVRAIQSSGTETGASADAAGESDVSGDKESGCGKAKAAGMAIGLCEHIMRSIEVSRPELLNLLALTKELAMSMPAKSVKSFEAFVRRIEKEEPRDVWIDGANIGHFNQNFEGGAFSFRQIESVVRHYEGLGRRPFLVIHSRWLREDTDLGVPRHKPKRRKLGQIAPQAAAAATAAAAASGEAELEMPNDIETTVAAAAAAAAVDMVGDGGKGSEEKSGSAIAAAAPADIDVSGGGDSRDGPSHSEPYTVDDDSNASIIAGWRKRGVLYEVPPRSNDDWFWLYGAVNSCLRGAKNVTIVSNDLMRDHHWRMLTPQSFPRWRERRQTHFSMSWVGDRSLGEFTLEIQPPPPFSRRVQSHSTGDSQIDGWHFPLQKSALAPDDTSVMDLANLVHEASDRNEWHVFSGDEIGVLLADWQLTNAKAIADGPKGQEGGAGGGHQKSFAVVNSTVSSKMLKALADAEGIAYHETLTGFKWLGNKSLELEEEGVHVLLAYEEAIGFMLTARIPDKDGVSAAASFCQMALSLKRTASSTVAARLQTLREKYGFFATNNGYFLCEDVSRIPAIFDAIRHSERRLSIDKSTAGDVVKVCAEGGANVVRAEGAPTSDTFSYPEEVQGYRIATVRDLTSGVDTAYDDKRARLPTSKSSQMITLTFENGCVLTLRGSGTEPKLKYYSEISSRKGMDEASSKLAAMVRAVVSVLVQPDVHGLAASNPDTFG